MTAREIVHRNGPVREITDAEREESNARWVCQSLDGDHCDKCDEIAAAVLFGIMQERARCLATVKHWNPGALTALSLIEKGDAK